jgi:hypothetical protein
MRDEDILDRSNVEHAFLGGGSTKFVCTSSTQYKGVQQIKKRSKDIHLLILSRYGKAYVSLMGVTRNLQRSAIEASLTQAIPNKFRNGSLRVRSPHHWSCQNLILESPPTSNLV